MAFSRGFRASRRCLSPLVELREYNLYPGYAQAWVDATVETAGLRVRGLPLRTFTIPESGGTLNVGTHSYYYHGGHAERDEKRSKQLALPEWQDYLSKCKPYVFEAKSSLFAEAPLVNEFGEIAEQACRKMSSVVIMDFHGTIRSLRDDVTNRTSPTFSEHDF